MYADEYYFDRERGEHGSSAACEERDKKPSQKVVLEDDDYEEQSIWQVSLRQKKEKDDRNDEKSRANKSKSWKTKFLD